MVGTSCQRALPVPWNPCGLLKPSIHSWHRSELPDGCAIHAICGVGCHCVKLLMLADLPVEIPTRLLQVFKTVFTNVTQYVLDHVA